LWGDGSQQESINLMNPVPGDIVSVIVTDLETGCSTETIDTINENGPEISVNPPGGILCAGDPNGIDFLFSIEQGNAPFVYQWTTPVDSIPNMTMPIFNEVGVYSVIVTDFFQCSNEVFFEIVAGEPTVAEFSYEISGDSVLFTNLSQHGLETVWYFGDGNSSSEEDPVHHYQVSGTYTVLMISIGYCNSDTISREITVTGVATKDLNSSHPEIYVIPNPNDGTFALLAQEKHAEVVRIFDMLGRDVPFTQEDTGRVQISSSLPGIYTVVARQGSIRYIARVIIQ
jgi:PKD repeat protein